MHPLTRNVLIGYAKDGAGNGDESDASASAPEGRHRVGGRSTSKSNLNVTEEWNTFTGREFF